MRGKQCFSHESPLQSGNSLAELEIHIDERPLRFSGGEHGQENKSEGRSMHVKAW